MTSGYYRFPTIYGDQIAFVSEDDLWQVSASGGMAYRLTSNLGDVGYPFFSPDGARLAFVGREEGAPEIYVMPGAGGQARRLTYLSSTCRVVGWMPDGESILFASTYAQPFSSEMGLFRVRADSTNGEVTPLAYGAARSISFGPNGGVVIGRNTGDPARWKRYRGGTAGHLWIDSNGDGEFQRLLADAPGNIASPMWLSSATAGDAGGPGRIYFVSDHEGIGNLYSCTPEGDDVQRHTDHEDYYVRNPSTDGARIVYHVGADLYVFDPATDGEQMVAVDYRSPRVQRNRKFVHAGRYLDGYALHPSGKAIAMATRGKLYTFFNHEGPVLQYGQRDGVRYREPVWLHDGHRLVVVSDAPGEEALELYSGQPDHPPERLEGLDIGRVVAMQASPVDDLVALINHRHELLLVNLATRELSIVDRSLYRNIQGFDWSPDGRWIAYSFGATSRTTEIRLYQLPEAPASSESDEGGDARRNGDGDGEGDQAAGGRGNGVTAATDPPDDGIPPLTTQGSRHVVTRPVLHDVRPAFDPEGKHLYFLSYREFNPVYDGLHFDLSFPWGMRPYLVTLQADLPNPFVPAPDFDDDDADAGDEDDDEDGDEGADEELEDGGEYTDEDGFDDDDDHDEDDDEDGAMYAAAVSGLRRQMRRARGRTHEGQATQVAGGAAGATVRGDRHRDRKAGNGKRKARPVAIDLDGIERRVIAFPVPDARYGQIGGVPGKAIFTMFPIQGQLDDAYEWGDEELETGSLRVYDFKEYKSETLADNATSFQISANCKKLIYAGRGQLRVIAAGEKAPGNSGPGRKSGWIDLHRVKVSVMPQGEWEQMFREAWRLQRDHFWTEDMSEVDWQRVYERYFALIPRISTRGEFSDLLWEMQGELGTSHAYEFGGDYRPRPYYGQGFLGARFTWDEAAGGYRVDDLVLGDSWDMRANSPLAAPGVDVRAGDVVVAINGQPLDAETGPAQLLVNQAGHEVLLTLRERPAEDAGADGRGPASQEGPADEATAESAPDASSQVKRAPPPAGQTSAAHHGGDRPVGNKAGASAAEMNADGANADGANADDEAPYLRSVIVRAIAEETSARYRQWVEANRRAVHAATDGQVGYVHVPDMGAWGYAEFHRGYLAEVDRDALIVDVRYNGGGHVSQLILEKLARRRLGYDLSRWGGLMPYPEESVAGPLVALTNEHAGSDGDIFCHSFKLMDLGPLIGKRTWGGVIGIAPSHALVDGTVTTQPEYSFWFKDVGWDVENYGTDPDIEVDYRPQDYASQVDPQLAQAILEARRLVAATPRKLPELTTKPSRALPKLPPRNHNANG